MVINLQFTVLLQVQLAINNVSAEHKLHNYTEICVTL